MTIALDHITAQLLDAATRAGATSAEASAGYGEAEDIAVRGGEIETSERSEGVELGLRVFLGDRSATVSGNLYDSDTITTMAERAIAMAKVAPIDETRALADPEQWAQDRDMARLDLADPTGAIGTDQLIDLSHRLENAALIDGIAQISTAGASYNQSHVMSANSLGFSAEYRRTSSSLGVVALAHGASGMVRDYDSDSRIYHSDLRSAEEIGARAAARTLETLGAVKPPSGRFPVLYDERISSSIIGHILSAMNGSSIVRGASWLRDAMGETILPTSLSLIEEPHRPRISKSRLFDAEGLPTQTAPLIQDGVLTRWILDLAAARKLDLDPTGNAARSIGGAPYPATWNITMTQSDRSKDDLLADMGTGLLVTSMIGSTINPTTGDYSRGASGFWVENGQIAYPVHECTIAANLRDMIANMQPANDARVEYADIVPSLLIDGMTIAGA